MRLAKLITPKIIKLLGVGRITAITMLAVVTVPAFSQDNSPYSRYGLGDQVPSTNIINRSMGGVSAGYIDAFSINYSNPASYSWFQSFKEPKSRKLSYGRAILDVGLNIESRTLREPNNTTNGKFTASNILFSHVQVGIPLRTNWGLTFGIRPVNRISYKMIRGERLYDPNTGLNIDTATTLSEGDGGAYLPNIGTAFKFGVGKNQWISLGANAGYLFGKKDYSTRRSLFNDTVAYNAGNWQTKTSYGNLYYTLGLQYHKLFADERTSLTIGIAGNLQQKLNASQDRIRETYYFDESVGYTRLDSVYEEKSIKGTITYPSSFTVGFMLQRMPVLSGEKRQGGWSVGIDFRQSQWSNYRFYGQPDSVRNTWEIRVGGELRPVPSSTSYFNNVSYRAGFFMGPDYIQVAQKLPQYGITAGLGLPIMPKRNTAAANQYTFVNLAFEYIKRGNNDNLLKENLFRMSLGLSLTDLWFSKRKYN